MTSFPNRLIAIFVALMFLSGCLSDSENEDIENKLPVAKNNFVV